MEPVSSSAAPATCLFVERVSVCCEEEEEKHVSMYAVEGGREGGREGGKVVFYLQPGTGFLAHFLQIRSALPQEETNGPNINKDKVVLALVHG